MSYKPWFLKDLEPPKENAPTVFSCFHCGGGSTMGYKLAGFNVLGGVEIDPKMMEVYRANHNPKYSYLMGVQDFKNIPDEELPKELFSLDVLDGSPPCSSFSTAGAREKNWGEKKKFREGQAEQVLDELFFDFIAIAKKLGPKVVVAENVSGLIKGNAKSYVKRIVEAFNIAGYDVQLFLLNAAFMGVPQKRERTFFIAKRKDMSFGKIHLDFRMEIIPVEKSFVGIDPLGKELTPDQLKWWTLCKAGNAFSSIHPKKHWFNAFKLHPDFPAPTLTASGGNAEPFHWSMPRKISDSGMGRIQTFPDDYDAGTLGLKYICGMSVPPKMMEKVALEIRKQWLDKIKVRKKK